MDYKMSKSKALQDMYDRHYDKPKNQGGVYQGMIESVRRVDNFTKPKPQVQEQIVYKLKHKGTGLFYHPNGSYQSVSKLGKVYSNRKPARQSHITIPYELRDEYPSHYHNAQTKLDDWIVVEYKLVEINKEK